MLVINIYKMKWLFVPLILLFVFSSCSVSRQIDRMTKRDMLTENGFENAHTGIAIFDAAKGRFLYNFQGDKFFVPASNTKLLSCYAAMKYLGDSLPGIRYEILNDTTVLIKGTGDPSVLHPDFLRQPVYDFLRRFKEIQYVPTDFKAYLGNGWAWDDYIYDYAAPRSSMPLYGDVVRMRLDDHGIKTEPKLFARSMQIAADISNGFSISRPWSENSFYVSPGRNKSLDVPFVPYDSTIVRLLGDTLHVPVIATEKSVSGNNFVYTIPLDSLLKIMMHRSDNFFAEQSLLMVSEKLLNEMDDGRIITTLLDTDFAGMPQKPRWVDGSGLSPYNLISPEDFVFVLSKLKNEFGLERMKTILPTGGTGTLSSLYKEEVGKIFAKTGTISGVVTLSGYLITKKNRLLIFSVLVNNHHTSSNTIRKGVEQFLKDIQNKY